jgi:small subunit ribosomal protein S6
MVILDSNKYAQDPNTMSQQIPNLVAKCGGEILVSRLWNEQKLVYPIDGHKKGTYWLTYFRMDSARLADFNRDLRISETIVRTLTLKVDPRLVDALVEHARSGGRAKPVETTSSPASKALPPGVEVPPEAAAIL